MIGWRVQPLSVGDCCRTMIKLSALSTPVMMVQMTIFQMGTGIDLIIANRGLPPSPAPGLRSFAVCLAVYGYIVVRPHKLLISSRVSLPFVLLDMTSRCAKVVATNCVARSCCDALPVPPRGAAVSPETGPVSPFGSLPSDIAVAARRGLDRLLPPVCPLHHPACHYGCR